MRVQLRLAALVAMAVSVSAPALAQQSRSQIIADQVAAKADAMQPPKSNRIETALRRIEQQSRPGHDSDGWSPTIGGLAPGAGLALGVRYRRGLAIANAHADLFASHSLRGYRRAEGYLTVPDIGGHAWDARTGIRYRDLPQERFYGLGQASTFADRSSFALRDVDYTVAITRRVRDRLKAGVETGYLAVTLGRGQDERFASVGDRFADLDAPGLAESADFLHTTVFLQSDTRTAPENPRAGGLHRVAFTRFLDVGTGGLTFNRFETDTSYHVPFFNERRVVSVRGLLILSDPDAGGEVPFYFMPTLGGSDRLRGVELMRFRDRHALLLGAEYRWEVFAALDMALFVDAGKVAHEIRQLGFHDLETTPGIGFRFNTRARVIVRLDLAHGAEGMQYHLRLGKAW